MFAAQRRCTLLYPTGPASDPNRNHLHIVLTDPYGPPGQVLLVPVCSVKDEAHDKSCILKPEDHPFVKHDSFIDYTFARVEPARKLAEGVENGVFVEKNPISEEVCRRVADGLLNSKFTKRFFKNFLREVDGAVKKAAAANLKKVP